MKKIILLALVLSVFMGIESLFAYPVNLKEISVSPGNVVNITIPIYSGGAEAGIYNIDIDFTPYNGVDNYVRFRGFCVDPVFSTYVPEIYDIISVGEGTPYERAAWLFNKYGSAAFSDPTLATNVQVAIWRLVFPILTVNDGWITSSQFYYDEALGVDLNTFNADGYRIAHNPFGTAEEDFQDYIIRVPEPMTILSLGFGLLSIAALLRLRKKAA